MKIALLVLASFTLQAAALSDCALAQQPPRPEIAQRKRFDATTARQLTALSQAAANKSIRGTCATLSGGSSADRSLAAQVVAKDGGAQLYRVDVSSVVGKYIGETEKNLELLFQRAEDKHWTLFFDDADALFGKRTDVRDSNDRYANVDIAALLQRIEQYQGVVLLSSNAPEKIDPAVARRCAPVRAATLP